METNKWRKGIIDLKTFMKIKELIEKGVMDKKNN